MKSPWIQINCLLWQASFERKNFLNFIHVSMNNLGLQKLIPNNFHLYSILWFPPSFASVLLLFEIIPEQFGKDLLMSPLRKRKWRMKPDSMSRSRSTTIASFFFIEIYGFGKSNGVVFELRHGKVYQNRLY